MLLVRYLGKRKIEVLCCKIKLFTKIKLKTVLCLLISESRLEECLEFGTRKRSAIIIIVGTSEETTNLYSKKLRYGGVLKIVEKYMEVGPGLV